MTQHTRKLVAQKFRKKRQLKKNTVIKKLKKLKKNAQKLGGKFEK